MSTITSIETHCASHAYTQITGFLNLGKNADDKKQFKSDARALPTQIHQVGVLYTLLHLEKKDTGNALSEFIKESLPELGKKVDDWSKNRDKTLIDLDLYTDYELREWCLLFAGYLKKFAEARISDDKSKSQQSDGKS